MPHGLNLVVKWNLEAVEIMTDSATVFGWLTSILTGSHRIKTHGLNEMLVKRRLAIVKELCDEYKLQVSTRWVASARNKSDVLTRVDKRWLKPISLPGQKKDVDVCCVAVDSQAIISEVHEKHHLGVDRTWYLVRTISKDISRDDVAKVINSCARCRYIDPAPVTWEKGELSCEENWSRIAADITHFNGKQYLTVVDCGPSRFTVWRKVASEDSALLTAEFEQIFRERGPPAELLMDNSTSFRSQRMEALCRKWFVRRIFRCAYRPAGNGIVERNHRTIKRMAARANADPLDMVFWYNVSPKDGTKQDTTPASGLHMYDWRIPLESVDVDVDDVGKNIRSVVKVGDAVYVKPPAARCTTVWPVGIVTAVNYENNIDINGVPRHVTDIRPVPVVVHADDDYDGVQEIGEDENVGPGPDDIEGNAVISQPEFTVATRPQRQRTAPDRYLDLDMLRD